MYQTQKKIYEGFHALSERQKEIGTMAMYECGDMRAWSSRENEKNNFLLNILQTSPEQIDCEAFKGVLEEIARNSPGLIKDETPPEEFEQLSGRLSERFTEISRTLRRENVQDELLYVDRESNTEDHSMDSLNQDFVLEISKLKQENRALQERLESAENEYESTLTEYKNENSQLREHLSDRDAQLEDYRRVQKKLHSMENLIEETRRSEEEFGKNFEKVCKQMHVEMIVNSAQAALVELRNFTTCNDKCSVVDQNVDESPESVMIYNRPSVEYLNKLLCELQDISHLFKECSYNSLQFIKDCEINISKILELKLDGRLFKSPLILGIDQDVQTDHVVNEMVDDSIKMERKDKASENRKLDKIYTETSSPLCGSKNLVPEESFSYLHISDDLTTERSSSPGEDNANVQEVENSITSTKSKIQEVKLDEKEKFAAVPKKAIEDKAIGTETRIYNSVKCQTEATVNPEAELLRNNAISMEEQPTEQIVDRDPNISKTISLKSQEEKMNQKKQLNQEKKIDELNRELLIKNSELHELQLSFNDLQDMNRSMQENIEKLEVDNLNLKQLIKDLKEKFRKLSTEPQNFPQKLSESKTTDVQSFGNLRWFGKEDKSTNMEHLVQKHSATDTQSLSQYQSKKSSNLVAKSMSDSIKESLYHIEESRRESCRSSANPSDTGRCVAPNTPMQKAEKERNSPPERDSSTSTIIYTPAARSPQSSQEISHEVTRKLTINSKNISLQKSGTASTQNAQNNSTKVKEGKIVEVPKSMLVRNVPDVGGSGNSSPGSNLDPNMKIIGNKIMKTGFSSLSSDELCYLHYQIVAAEMKRQAQVRTTTISTSTTITHNESSCRIDVLLKRLQTCKNKAQDLHEKLLYASLEKILMQN